jgi:hypothetical protein
MNRITPAIASTLIGVPRARQENQPKPIRDIAWKGQVRLCARYRRLARTGKPANVVTTAIARELAGFVWAIARQVTVSPG